MLDVARTPPFVKGLAETRARAAGEVERYQIAVYSLATNGAKALANVKRYKALGAALKIKLAGAQAEVERCYALHGTFQVQLAKAQSETDACDLFLVKSIPDVDPSRIPSVQAWQGRYGQLGALRKAIVDHLRACDPGTVSTLEIAEVLQWKFQLEFPTVAARQKWVAGSVRAQLRVLKAEGLAERLLGPEGGFRTYGIWRLKKQRATTMAELRAMAAAAGLGTVQADDIPDGAPEGAAEGVEA